jgi:hypothetical protein
MPLRNIAIALLIILMWPLSSHGGTVMFEEANKLYHNKQYTQSAELYMHIINDGFYSCSIYYNAGNAFYKSKQLGRAVWCYEKALQYEPENINIIENLQLTLKKLNQVQALPKDNYGVQVLRKVLHWHTLNKWCIGALLFFVIAISISALRSLRSTWPMLIGIKKVCYTLFAVYASAAICNYIFHYYQSYGIATTHAALMPQATPIAKAVASLPEGSKVRIVDKTKDAQWYKVKAPDGQCLWVTQSQFSGL